MKKRTVIDMKVTVFKTVCREHGVDARIMANIMRDVRDIEMADKIKARRMREWAEALCRGEEWAKHKCAMQ